MLHSFNYVFIKFTKQELNIPENKQRAVGKFLSDVLLLADFVIQLTGVYERVARIKTISFLNFTSGVQRLPIDSTTARSCTISPRITGPWTAKTTETVKPHLAFNFHYYIAIDDVGNPECLMESDPGRLMQLLYRNDPSADSPFKVLDDHGPCVPLASSRQTAMVLGFFAEKLEKLRLVELSYTGLLSGAAPYSHPMGSF